jgi:nudix-type nucleoside diphosphatase (YffH/AdpP family)
MLLPPEEVKKTMMNTRVKNLKKEILSNNWATLSKVTYEYLNSKGVWNKQVRESYDRGDGATILLFDPHRKTVILTSQFRLPTFMNKNESGLLIEAIAGKVDDDSPEDCVIRESEEEAGFHIKKITKIFESYMSPGSVTEILHFFIAEYDQSMKVSEGGGLASEQEDIEVLEIPLDKAFGWIEKGILKDGKTIMLLQHLKLRELLVPEST